MMNIKEALETMSGLFDCLYESGCLFEVNTGAIARGYRTIPYPQMEFLKEFFNSFNWELTLSISNWTSIL